MERTEPTDAAIAPPVSLKPPRSLSRFVPGWVSILLNNRKALVGVLILLFFVLIALFADTISPVNPMRMVGRPHEAPSSAHLLGTTRQGQDVFSQLVHGTQTTLAVGFVTGTIVMAIAIVVGITAGYVGGWVDELLSLFTNIVLILPGLPLIIVVSRWIERPGPETIVIVLSLISWAYGARVLRAQTLTLRNADFVAAAKIVGEPTWRIVLFEILPNMTSLVVSSWIGAVLYAILTEAALEFIGLGNPNLVTWGTILYWAQNNAALLTKAWWTFIPPGICIALVGFSLTMINYGIDEISNPRLRRETFKIPKQARVESKQKAAEAASSVSVS